MEQIPPEPSAVTFARLEALLAEGEIDVAGLTPWSSNYVFLVGLKDAEIETWAIYKPSRGEQRLWDFPDGSLCRREVAAYALSRFLGWPHVPPVVLREGPHGMGTLQFYVPNNVEDHFFSIREDPASDEAMRRIALFDVFVNNADRKGGHVLRGADGTVWAIDHGLTFHVDHKLRTVIWDYAGEALSEDFSRDLEHLLQALNAVDDPLASALIELITRREMAALRERVGRLVRTHKYPMPRKDWRNVPYPLI